MKNRSVVYTLWDEDQKGRGFTFDGGEILTLQGLSDGHPKLIEVCTPRSQGDARTPDLIWLHICIKSQRQL